MAMSQIVRPTVSTAGCTHRGMAEINERHLVIGKLWASPVFNDFSLRTPCSLQRSGSWTLAPRGAGPAVKRFETSHPRVRPDWMLQAAWAVKVRQIKTSYPAEELVNVGTVWRLRNSKTRRRKHKCLGWPETPGKGPL